MNSYSERKIFDPNDVRLFRVAEKLVGKIDKRAFDDELRCHEITRAVGQILKLPHQDGQYLFAAHSWLWIRPIEPNQTAVGKYPRILDVYAVGSLPQVQLLDTLVLLQRVGIVYKPGEERTDIKQHIVDELVRQMQSNRTRGSRCRACGCLTFGSICAKCKGEK
ncbi:MAG: hypothetical protein V3S30_08135 [Thermoanaerobaculia bacterium]